MKRVFSSCAIGALGVSIALAFAACDNEADDESGYGGGGGGAGCAQFTTCGQCTPVDGCGWCATPNGQGLCAADPNECATASSFTWTWDPQGCFVPADASVVPATDAGGGVDASGTKPDDAGPGTPTDAALPTDAPRSSSDASDGAASDSATPLSEDAAGE